MRDIHYPTEYEIGEVTFFGRKFYVTPDVLIPRLETEMLVRHARYILGHAHIDTLVDVGSGSGIIGVSCADLVPKLISTDISREALQITEKNYHLYFNEETTEFLCGSLLDPISGREKELGSILIVTNLPYIRAEDWENMSPDTRFEPRLALFGGETTGFELYEQFFVELKNIFRSASSCMCLIEFGYDQRQICEKILQTYEWKYEFFPDYAGIERFCKIY